MVGHFRERAYLTYKVVFMGLLFTLRLKLPMTPEGIKRCKLIRSCVYALKALVRSLQRPKTHA